MTRRLLRAGFALVAFLLMAAADASAREAAGKPNFQRLKKSYADWSKEVAGGKRGAK